MAKTQNRKFPQGATLLARLLASDPMSSSKTLDMRYQDVRVLTSDGTPGIFGTEQTFRLNSLFDPDLTNTGHQPYGYDQVTPFYGSYLVEEAKIEVEFSGSNSNSLFAALTVQSGQNTTSLAGSLLSFGLERQSILGKALPIDGRNVWRHVEVIPIHKVVGLTKAEHLGDPNYRALVGANPASQVYFRLAVADPVGASKTCIQNVCITYRARMFDPISVATS